MGKVIKIKDLPKSVRPREKALKNGISSLSDQELLALLLRSGTAKQSVLDLSKEVLIKTNGLSGLMRVNLQELMSISGIKEAKALNLLAVIELGKRISKTSLDVAYRIEEPESIIDWLNYEIGYKNQEHFIVLYLNHQLEVLSFKTLFIGTVDRSLVHPRDVFREAFKANASAMILVHNHPGKTMKASLSDLKTTSILLKHARSLGIDILDHLIVSYGQFLSIRQEHPKLFEE